MKDPQPAYSKTGAMGRIAEELLKIMLYCLLSLYLHISVVGDYLTAL